MVRAKFQVTNIIHEAWMPADARRVILEPRYDTSIEEDRRYSKATPSGRIEMYIDNPPAVAAFPLNSVHYIDFTEA